MNTIARILTALKRLVGIVTEDADKLTNEVAEFFELGVTKLQRANELFTDELDQIDADIEELLELAQGRRVDRATVRSFVAQNEQRIQKLKDFLS